MAEENEVINILRSYGLKKTAVRSGILKLFLKHNHALSAIDVMQKLDEKPDRVTVYRALSSFEEHGILHKASMDGQAATYAMCSGDCPDHRHIESHAHFICEKCNHTFCLEQIEVPQVKLPEQFTVHSVNYTFNGICRACA